MLTWLTLAMQIVSMFWPMIEDCITVEKVKEYGFGVQWLVYRAAKAEARQSGASRRESRLIAKDAVVGLAEEISRSTDREILSAIQGMREYASDLEREQEGDE